MGKKYLSVKVLVAFFLVGIVLVVAVSAPWLISAERVTEMDITSRLKPPSMEFLLGTDQLGRDIMARILIGTQTSIVLSIASISLAIVIGVPIGLISGYAGGWIDNITMRFIDALLSFPMLLLALVISAVLGPSFQNTVLAIGIAFSPFLARVVRGESLRVAHLPFVEAARAAGTRNSVMLIRHILPNTVPAIIVQATIGLAFAVLAEAALSFLGLGTQPPMASWGLMIQSSRQFLDVAPWTALAPGMALFVTIVGFNLLGDVLRDMLDPRTI